MLEVKLERLMVVISEISVSDALDLSVFVTYIPYIYRFDDLQKFKYNPYHLRPQR